VREWVVGVDTYCSERVGGYSKVNGCGTISEGVDGTVLLAM